MRSVWLARFETRHFSFKGYGATAAEAEAALGRALCAHARQYGLEPGWPAEMVAEAASDYPAQEFRLGEGYRDDATLTL